ncbi:TonB-dependent receptor [Rhodocyclus tenuis]|uniref:TonB-dependent receptor n=1 Tax=Rhodocyclus tenuis TaxID=1066 RepID=UPI00190521B5|nr:TonB-dependent receptor [Rhodocyclus tenuis]MBK1679207.1 hypothetical protein [Rhodocyclus tenuis]
MNRCAFPLAQGALAVALALAAIAAPATAAEMDVPDQVRSISIASQPLAQALNDWARQFGMQLVVPQSLLAGKQAPALSGKLTSRQALDRLLAGSGLSGSIDGATVVIRARSAGEEATLGTVTVTGAADLPGNLPKPYAGGQTARGSKLGILGNKDILDTPFATTSYTSELIENQNARTVAEVLSNDPSVRFTTPAGHQVENYYIRGFLVTADNMAMNGMYGVAPYGHIPTEFIERVEILKGPSALLNGMAPKGAVGGTVNIVTKKAGDAPLTRVGVDFISAGQVGTTLDLGRRFGERKEWGVRFNGAYRDGDTELDDQTKNRRFGSLGVDYRGERLRADFDIYDSRERSTGSPLMISFATAVIAPPDARTNIFKGVYGEMENRGVALKGEFDLNEHLTAFASVAHRENRQRGYINGTRADNVSQSGAFTVRPTHQNGYVDSDAYEAGMRAKFATGPVRHEVVLAASSLEMESGRGDLAAAGVASNIYNPATPALSALPGSPKLQETKLDGVALADTLSFWGDRLALTLGLRQQKIKDKGFNATTGALTSQYDKTVTTPAVGIVVKPWSPNLALYANYVEGLAQGGVAPASSGGVTVVNANAVFAPYVTKQREVGAKWDAGQYAHTLALYEIAEPMLVYNGPDSARVYSVDGEKQVRGLEWSVMGQLTRNVRLLGGVTLARSEQKKTTNGVNDGKDAYGIPDWQGNLGLEWDTPWLPGLTLSGRAIHTDSQYLNYANTREIPSWTRYDVGARFKTVIAGRATVFNANISNLFDRNYWAGPYHGEGYTTIGAPRTLSLSATVDF